MVVAVAGAESDVVADAGLSPYRVSLQMPAHSHSQAGNRPANSRARQNPANTQITKIHAAPGDPARVGSQAGKADDVTAWTTRPSGAKPELLTEAIRITLRSGHMAIACLFEQPEEVHV